MTIVEFFDANAVENIISALLCAPERVVLVGDSYKRMEKAKAKYESIAAAHGVTVEFLYETVNRNNLENIIDKLESIVDTYGECVFDLTGGEDLYLVAVGTVFCTHRDRVQLHRFNIHNGKLYDCDADGQVLATKQAYLSVEENISVYGGRVIFEEEKKDTTYRWNFHQDFCNDIMYMWEMCKADFSDWNWSTHTLDGFHKYCVSDATSLSVYIDINSVSPLLAQKKHTAYFSPDFYKRLALYGLIHNLTIAHNTIAFTYKNEQVKRALTNAGRLLELFVAKTAGEMTDENGIPLFDDVMTGVTIDWDGKLETDIEDVENEIDVILMKDLTPIFISCKNGKSFKSDELYKLSTVAGRFGGKYAKKVLVATRLDEMGEAGEAIVNRADDMCVSVIKVRNGEQCEERFKKALEKLGG